MLSLFPNLVNTMIIIVDARNQTTSDHPDSRTATGHGSLIWKKKQDDGRCHWTLTKCKDEIPTLHWLKIEQLKIFNPFVFVSNHLIFGKNRYDILDVTVGIFS